MTEKRFTIKDSQLTGIEPDPFDEVVMRVPPHPKSWILRTTIRVEDGYEVVFDVPDEEAPALILTPKDQEGSLIMPKVPADALDASSGAKSDNVVLQPDGDSIADLSGQVTALNEALNVAKRVANEQRDKAKELEAEIAEMTQEEWARKDDTDASFERLEGTLDNSETERLETLERARKAEASQSTALRQRDEAEAEVLDLKAALIHVKETVDIEIPEPSHCEKDKVSMDLQTYQNMDKSLRDLRTNQDVLGEFLLSDDRTIKRDKGMSPVIDGVKHIIRQLEASLERLEGKLEDAMTWKESAKEAEKDRDWAKDGLSAALHQRDEAEEKVTRLKQRIDQLIEEQKVEDERLRGYAGYVEALKLAGDETVKIEVEAPTPLTSSSFRYMMKERDSAIKDRDEAFKERDEAEARAQLLENSYREVKEERDKAIERRDALEGQKKQYGDLHEYLMTENYGYPGQHIADVAIKTIKELRQQWDTALACVEEMRKERDELRRDPEANAEPTPSPNSFMEADRDEAQARVEELKKERDVAWKLLPEIVQEIKKDRDSALARLDELEKERDELQEKVNAARPWESQRRSPMGSWGLNRISELEEVIESLRMKRHVENMRINPHGPMAEEYPKVSVFADYEDRHPHSRGKSRGKKKPDIQMCETCGILISDSSQVFTWSGIHRVDLDKQCSLMELMVCSYCFEYLTQPSTRSQRDKELITSLYDLSKKERNVALQERDEARKTIRDIFQTMNESQDTWHALASRMEKHGYIHD